MSCSVGVESFGTRSLDYYVVAKIARMGRRSASQGGYDEFTSLCSFRLAASPY